jgi:hypothetical protein
MSDDRKQAHNHGQKSFQYSRGSLHVWQSMLRQEDRHDKAKFPDEDGQSEESQHLSVPYFKYMAFDEKTAK